MGESGESNIRTIFIKNLIGPGIKTCNICQMVKINNNRKGYEVIPIVTKNKFEKVFIDICGLFLCSGGCRQCKYLIIILDHHSKFVKLYLVNRAMTTK